MTAVHPESYPLVEQIALSLKTTVKAIIEQPQMLEKVDSKQLEAGAYTLKDILTELKKPGAIRATSLLRRRSTSRCGSWPMCSRGWCWRAWVTNVTKFGAFVDIGVHQMGWCTSASCRIGL